MKKVARFLVSVKAEVKKVKWPTKKEMIKYSVATIIFVTVFALLFSLMDIALTAIKVYIG